MSKAVKQKPLSIGDLATVTGVEVTTVRFYERRGLMPAPPRRPSGYRMYDALAAQRLLFIQQAKQLGFSLSEIAELLKLQVEKGRTCQDVKGQALNKITDIDQKIEQLRHFKHALGVLVRQCDKGGAKGECPILEALNHPKMQ